MATLPDLPQTEAAIVEMTNAFRRERGLGALAPNAALAAAARAFAQYLARSGSFAHEADGRQPHERAEAHGYHYCFVAENLALNGDSGGFETRALARQMVDGWKGSAGHRANMLAASATETGVAVARSAKELPTYIAVQLFGRPRSLEVVFRIENRAGGAVRYRLGEEVHELPPRTVVTHTSCEPGRLTFERAGAPGREPANGERFVVRGGVGGVAVDIERE
jgi:hypothetical protein